MSELVDCINNLSAKDIIKSAAKTANGVPFYIQTSGLSGFCATYQAYYDAMTTKPSAAYAAAQNTLFCGLVDAGYWANDIDLMYWFAQETNGGGEAQINAKNPGTFDCVEIPNGGALAFTALEGLQGDNAACLNTSWIAGTHAVNFTQDSCGIIMGAQTLAPANTYDVGAGDGTRTVRLSYNQTGYSKGMMCGTDENSPVTIVAPIHLGFRRTDNNTMRWDMNKVHSGDAGASDGVPITYPFYIFAYNNSNSVGLPCARRISYVIVTSGLSDADSDIIVDLCEACLDSVGKGLLP